MKHITGHIDFASPWSWLAFADLPRQLEGLSWHAQWRPVAQSLLRQAHGMTEPAPAQADWERRHALWVGKQLGVGLDWPTAYPFDPGALLLLALECSDDGSVNRFVAASVLRHVWLGGADALAPDRLQALRAQLAPQLRCSATRAAELLRANTEAALALGVFDVPSFTVSGALLHGYASLPMLREALATPA